MRILNFGSLNLDHVYSVDSFVRPGETIASSRYRQFCGGKGLNQSVALARAGAQVHHAGKVGEDGAVLVDMLRMSGVVVDLVEKVEGPSGHAIIQVNRDGENAIIIHGGANRGIGADDVSRAIGRFSAGDWLLLQNEISAIPTIMESAAGAGMKIALNPTPMGPTVAGYPLNLVDCFVVNQIEGQELTGCANPEQALDTMVRQYPGSAVVMTLGAGGAIYADNAERIRVSAPKVDPVDTTAAGDTFIGFFFARLMAGDRVETCLNVACRAAALCVTRAGAAPSIPALDEVIQ